MSGHILTGPPGMPTSISVRLDRALATDDGKFLRQLAEIDPRFDVVDLQDRPESLAVFGGLWILHLDVQLDGIWKYLAQTEGDTFGSALRWCRDIGANAGVSPGRAAAVPRRAGSIRRR